MRGWVRWSAIVAVASVGWLAAATAAASPGAVPGVVNQAKLTDRDFARMQQGGVQTLRFLIWRREIETAPGKYDWSSVDLIVAGAAEHGIGLLPFVYGSPAWAHDVDGHPPLDGPAERRDWQVFLTALVQRYGRHGAFWAGPEPDHPIRRWQIWNEPNFDFYWDPEPSPRDYAELVSISADAIRAADPKAKIVLGGVARVRLGMDWWRFLAQLYDVPGIKRDFDYVALHPYSPGIHVLRDYVELARHVMREAGDRRTPLSITEVGWASTGVPGAPLVVGKRKQARLLRRSFALLSRPDTGWHISDIHWYAWRDAPPVEVGCSFCEYAGLFDLDGEAKPSWRAFKRAARRSGTSSD